MANTIQFFAKFIYVNIIYKQYSQNFVFLNIYYINKNVPLFKIKIQSLNIVIFLFNYFFRIVALILFRTKKKIPMETIIFYFQLLQPWYSAKLLALSTALTMTNNKI